MKRSISITEQELKKLGYDVVPFFLTHDVWNSARDYMQAFMANGYTPQVFKDMLDSCEDVMPNVKTQIGRYNQGSWSKFFSTWFSEIRGQGRIAHNFKSSSRFDDKKFEQLLKRRDAFAH